MTPPSRDPKGSCSDDIALARRLSQSLSTPRRPAGKAPAVAAAAAAVPYARFSPPRPVAPPLPTFRPPRAMGVGQEGWNRLLHEVQAFATASGVFVIDGSGLMVAASSQGAAREELEGMGSRLLVALEQADRMTGQASRSLSVDLADRVLTGIRVRAADGVAVTMALVTRAPLTDAVRAGLYQMLPDAP